MNTAVAVALAFIAALLLGPRTSHAQVLPSAPPPLSLPQALEEALASHPSLAAALAGVQGAEADVTRNRAGRLPSVTVRGGVTRYEFPMVVAPLHALDLMGAPPEFDQTLIQGRAELLWTVYDAGDGTGRIRGSRAGAAAAGARAREVEASLLEATAAAYLEVLTAARVREAGAERIRALQAEVERVGRLLEEGRAARVELLRAEAALQQAEASQAGVDLRLRNGERALARLMGRDPAALRDLPLPPVHLSTPDEEAGSEGLHPALLEARSRVEAAEAGASVARSTLLPRVEAVAGLNQFGGGSSSTSAEWDAGLRLALPFFTGGSRRGSIQQADAGVRAAREELRWTELRVADEGDRALAMAVEAEARLRALAAGVEALEEVVRIEALALEEGAGVQRDFLDAQASLLEARAGVAAAEQQAVLARLARARSRGVLTLGWIVDRLEGTP